MSLRTDFTQPIIGLDPLVQNSFQELDKELTRANIDAEQDTDGNTRLHLAAARASAAMIVFLLNKGASMTIRNKKGLNAYQMIPQDKPGLRVLFFS